MKTAANLISMLLKTSKNQPKYFHHFCVKRTKYLFHGDLIGSHLLKNSFCCKVEIPPLTQIRKIHATGPKRALHPLILLLLKPISRIITITFGKLIRMWWKKLTPQEKKVIWSKIRKKKSFIVLFGTFFLVIFALYFFDHVVETPLTKRRRFMMINDEVLLRISLFIRMCLLKDYKNEIVPFNHPFYLRSRRVAASIIWANKDIKEFTNIPWTLTVIDRPDIINACCLADGSIFIYTGMLNTCTNDDQLAIVLSHEISHVVLSHLGENLSKMYFVSALLLIPSVINWAVFSSGWAFMSDLMVERLSNILINLPCSRTIEREADIVGLYLAAKACVDVREASVLWSKMAHIESHYSSGTSIKWLSTHPSSDSRKEDMVKFIPAALNLRSQSNCPKLKDNQPSMGK